MTTGTSRLHLLTAQEGKEREALLLLGKSFSETDILCISFLLVKLGYVPTQEALAKRNETILQGWECSHPRQIQSSASLQGAVALDWQKKVPPIPSCAYDGSLWDAVAAGLLLHSYLHICVHS